MPTQAEIIEGFLQSGLLQRPVERIDTHSAIVLLSGDRAIKIKRQIQFPFLDYSTLERRRRACESEIQINQRFAPEIYKQVIPIRRDPTGRFYFGGQIGDVVEWAIEMRRFDQDDILENVIAREGMSLLLARKVAEAIQNAHAEAPVSDTETWLGSLLSFIKSNDTELKTFDDLFPSQRVQALTDRSLSLYENLRPTLRRRGNAGLVRQCHGDLHLANVVMIAGKPTLFDALEFDPSMAAGDVMYDLAFLLMDLINIGQVKAANMVLNDYLIRSDHLLRFAGLAALPLFMSFRAAIRAKVSVARMSVVPREKQFLWKIRALSYFELAERLLRPCQAALIGVGGLSGSGKSVLACGIAPDFLPQPGAILLRSDVERKSMFGGGSD
ncbi:MAG TPA: phosphotransferase, partial [Nitrospiraceae bacterium]|nr:phosphotransferase [Nitrospiraceae bacterium]